MIVRARHLADSPHHLGSPLPPRPGDRLHSLGTALPGSGVAVPPRVIFHSLRSARCLGPRLGIFAPRDIRRSLSPGAPRCAHIAWCLAAAVTSCLAPPTRDSVRGSSGAPQPRGRGSRGTWSRTPRSHASRIGERGCAEVRGVRVAPVPRRQREGLDRPPMRTSAGRHGRTRHTHRMGDAPVSRIAGGGLAGSGRYHVGFGARHQGCIDPHTGGSGRGQPPGLVPSAHGRAGSKEKELVATANGRTRSGTARPGIGADILPRWSQPHPGGQAWPGRRCGPAWHQGTRHGGAEGARDPPVRTERGIARTDRRHRSLALAPPSGASASGSRVAGRCAPPHTRSRERLGACMRERSARVLA